MVNGTLASELRTRFCPMRFTYSFTTGSCTSLTLCSTCMAYCLPMRISFSSEYQLPSPVPPMLRLPMESTSSLLPALTFLFLLFVSGVLLVEAAGGVLSGAAGGTLLSLSWLAAGGFESVLAGEVLAGVVLSGVGDFCVSWLAAGGFESVLAGVVLSGAGAFCVSWASANGPRHHSKATARAMARNFMGLPRKTCTGGAGTLIILPLTRLLDWT